MKKLIIIVSAVLALLSEFSLAYSQDEKDQTSDQISYVATFSKWDKKVEGTSKEFGLNLDLFRSNLYQQDLENKTSDFYLSLYLSYGLFNTNSTMSNLKKFKAKDLIKFSIMQNYCKKIHSLVSICGAVGIESISINIFYDENYSRGLLKFRVFSEGILSQYTSIKFIFDVASEKNIEYRSYSVALSKML